MHKNWKMWTLWTNKYIYDYSTTGAMKVFRLKETTSLSQRNSTLTTQTSACLQEHAGLTKVSNWSLIRSSSSRTWASFFTKSWALPGSGRFPVHREISACHSEIDVKSGWEGHPAITFVHFSCLKGRAEFREMPYLWSPWLWQTQPCWMLQTENKQTHSYRKPFRDKYSAVITVCGVR